MLSIFLSDHSNFPLTRDDLGLNLIRLTLVLALNSRNRHKKYYFYPAIYQVSFAT